MPARTNLFQQTIKAIESSLACNDASVEESAMVVNNQGEETEIDILITQRLQHRTLRIAIECSKSSRHPQLGWLQRLHGKYQQVPSVDRTVAVANKRFGPHSIKFAKDVGIELLVLKQLESSRWIPADLVSDDTPAGYLRQSERLAFIFADDIDLEQLVNVLTPECSVQTHDGTHTQSWGELDDMLKYFMRQRVEIERQKHKRPLDFQVIPISYQCANVYVIGTNGKRYKVKGAKSTTTLVRMKNTIDVTNHQYGNTIISTSDVHSATEMLRIVGVGGSDGEIKYEFIVTPQKVDAKSQL